jgi:hypothetical protein
LQTVKPQFTTLVLGLEGGIGEDSVSGTDSEGNKTQWQDSFGKITFFATFFIATAYKAKPK